jgi:MIP family channel proteins
MGLRNGLWREILAEGVGTFCLVFVGTGAIVVNTMSGGAITHLGISFVFGAVVAALIYALGHFNPAVTLAFWFLRYCPSRAVFPFIAAQLWGATLASGLIRLCLGDVAALGSTLPRQGNWSQAFVMETILTFILMLVICGSALHPNAAPGMAGLAIGLTVGLEAAFGGPISGASMNPARSFGPALVSGTWSAHWVYWVAPMLGAGLAVVLWKVLYPITVKE